MERDEVCSWREMAGPCLRRTGGEYHTEFDERGKERCLGSYFIQAMNTRISRERKSKRAGYETMIRKCKKNKTFAPQLVFGRSVSSQQ